MSSWTGEGIGYLNVCKDAAKNEDSFCVFKSNVAYTTVLEHCNYNQAAEHLDIIKNQTPQLLDVLDRFSINDKYGSPDVALFDPVDFCYEFTAGHFSPTTIQYVKVLSDLIANFSLESLDGLRVLEIGVGYGGQYTILSEYINFDSYTFVDLPEVIDLTKTYLGKLGKKNEKTKFIKHSDNVISELGDYDLVISNFAFSELYKDLQTKYIDKFKQIQRGYLHCNQISNDCFSKRELCGLIDGNKRCIRDVPTEHPDNYIMIWDN